MKIEKSSQYREFQKNIRDRHTAEEATRNRTFLRRINNGTDSLEISGEAKKRFDLIQQARAARDRRERENITHRFEILVARIERFAGDRGISASQDTGTGEMRNTVLEKTAEIITLHLLG